MTYYLRPTNYKEAFEIALAILSAKLDNDPHSAWRIKVIRDDKKPLAGIEISHDQTGKTKSERLDSILEFNVQSVEDQALIHRIKKEHDQKEAREISKRIGRPSKSEGGKSYDLIIGITVNTLVGLGWQLSRNETSEQTSAFDAVAKAMAKLKKPTNTYKAVTAAYYRFTKMKRF